MSPQTALLAALDAGQLGGIALDVYDHEAELAVALRGSSGSAVGHDAKPSAEEVACRSERAVADIHPEARAALELAQRDNVICTPHNAFNSYEGVVRKTQHSVQQITAFLNTGKFLWPARVGS
jgi:D-lactate dehydrogenase